VRDRGERYGEREESRKRDRERECECEREGNESGRDTHGDEKSRADRRIWFGIYVRGEKEQKQKQKQKETKKGTNVT
jgi:hypothetical protein